MKNFSIGQDIVGLLQSDTAVTNAVGNKIFPLIATAETTFPFIVYRRSYFTPVSNKDFESEKCGVELIVASNKYSESVSIADAVSDALNHQATTNIEDIKVTNASEDFYDDTYLQRITVEVEIK